MRAVQLIRGVVVGVAVFRLGGLQYPFSQRDSTLKTVSAIAPPELAAACPITQSGIESLVVKTTGLAYNGARFGNVGTYTYHARRGEGHGQSQATHAPPTIVDLKNAADGTGAVKYSFDVVILTPTDPAKANGTLLYEVVNRGRTIRIGRATGQQHDGHP
jgi:hypothetical protein